MTDFMNMMGFRESAISEIVSNLADREDRDDPAVQERVCRKAGIPLNQLLSYEIEEIERRVKDVIS